MKFDLKTIEKAVDRIKKDGGHTVELLIYPHDARRLHIKYYSALEEECLIILADADSGLFDYTTKTERF